jgi:iron complex outermembrane receptor protein
MKMEVQDPEKLNDFEFGLRHNTAKRSWMRMFYYMAQDQLILTGELDVGCTNP